MNYEAEVRKLVNLHDYYLRVSKGGQWEELTCVAPDKQVWTSTGTHEVVCAGSRGQRIGPDFWKAILDDITPGSEPCVNTPCDWCEGN